MAQSGDFVQESTPEMLEGIFRSYWRLLFVQSHRILQDNGLAEDCVQETFVRILKRLEFFCGLESRRQVNYLITTVRNLSYDMLRAKSRQSLSLSDEDLNLENQLPDEVDLEQSVLLRQDLRRLSEIWPSLPSEDRQILERRYILEQRDREIGQAFSLSDAAVRMRLTRARRRALALMTQKKQQEADKAALDA